MLRGYENGADVNGGLTFPVAFPGTISKPQTVTLASSALANGTFDILQEREVLPDLRPRRYHHRTGQLAQPGILL